MNISPTPPSGTQLPIPIRPPGLQTRSSSAAVFSLFGREHRAEDRDHDVELALAEGKVGGVSLDEIDLEPLGGGTLTPALEQGGDEVDADRVAPGAPRRGKGAVATAAGDVEHPLIGHDVHRFDQLLGQHLDHSGDHREVTLRPGLLLRLTDCLHIHRVAHLRSLLALLGLHQLHTLQAEKLMQFARPTYALPASGGFNLSPCGSACSPVAATVPGSTQ